MAPGYGICFPVLTALQTMAEAMRKLDMRRRTTGELPESVQMTMEKLNTRKPSPKMQIVVEKARRVQTMAATGQEGYFCVVQLREAKVKTQVVTADEPRWSETFEMALSGGLFHRYRVPTIIMKKGVP